MDIASGRALAPRRKKRNSGGGRVGSSPSQSGQKQSTLNRKDNGKSTSENVDNDNRAWVLNKAYDLGKRAADIDYRSHAESFFRFTYRRDFPPLAPYTSLTSDAGWGCMLRAAQMLMGYTLKRHYLGSDWRLPKQQKETNLSQSYDYCNIVRWFCDYPGYPHIYALHHLIQCGMKYDKLPGEWYGPSTAALVLRDLSHLHRVKYGGQVEVMVTQGDVIYITEVEKLCSNLSLNDCLLGLTALHENEEEVDKDNRSNNNNNTSSCRSNNKPSSSRVTESGEVDCISGDACGKLSKSPTHLSKLSIQNPVDIHTNQPAHQEHDTATGVTVTAGSHSSNHTQSQSSENSHDRFRINYLEEAAALPPVVHAKQSGDASPRGAGVHENTHFVTEPSRTAAAAAASTTAAAVPLPLPPPLPLLAEVTSATAAPTTAAKDPFFDPLLRPPPAAVAPWKHALLVLIPLRLGINAVNAEYVEELKEALRDPHCVGIIGGRPHHAIYFVGYRDNVLLGLDPHTVFANPPKPPPAPPASSIPHSRASSAPVSPAVTTAAENPYTSTTAASGAAAGADAYQHTVDTTGATAAASVNFLSSEYISQVHVPSFVPLNFSQLDPSLTIGFYFENRVQFERFCDETRKSVERKLSIGRTPLFSVQHSPPSFDFDSSSSRPAKGQQARGSGATSTAAATTAVAGTAPAPAGTEVADHSNQNNIQDNTAGETTGDGPAEAEPEAAATAAVAATGISLLNDSEDSFSAFDMPDSGMGSHNGNTTNKLFNDDEDDDEYVFI